jgi:hypothetical protein
MKKKRRRVGKNRTIVLIREVNSSQLNPRLDPKSISDAKTNWLLEFVLLVLFLSFIPDLYISGINDRFGPCGFDAPTCSLIETFGLYKMFLGSMDVIVIYLLVKVILRRKSWEVLS